MHEEPRAIDLEKGIKVAEAVQEWYALSKPCQLKIIDMRTPYAALFGDVEAACRMMTVGTQDYCAIGKTMFPKRAGVVCVRDM